MCVCDPLPPPPNQLMRLRGHQIKCKFLGTEHMFNIELPGFAIDASSIFDAIVESVKSAAKALFGGRRSQRGLDLDSDAASDTHVPCGDCRKIAVTRTLKWMRWAQEMQEKVKRMREEAAALVALVAELNSTSAAWLNATVPSADAIVTALGEGAGNATAAIVNDPTFVQSVTDAPVVQETFGALLDLASEQLSDADELELNWRSQWLQFEAQSKLFDNATIDTRCPELKCDAESPGHCLLVHALVVREWAAARAVNACADGADEESWEYNITTQPTDTRSEGPTPQDDSCMWARDSVCDHGSVCLDGSDCTDCNTCSAGFGHPGGGLGLQAYYGVDGAGYGDESYGDDNFPWAFPPPPTPRPTRDRTRPHDGCRPDEAACCNKRCIPRAWKNDGDNDCGDGSDERNQCGFADEADEYDYDAPSSRPTFDADGYDYDAAPSSTPRPTPRSTKQPTREPTASTTACDEDEGKCCNGKCIPLRWQGDGDNDCGDNSDEEKQCGFDTAATGCLPDEDAYINNCCATKATGSCQDQATTYDACWSCNRECFRPESCRHATSSCKDTGFVCHAHSHGDTEYCQDWHPDSVCQNGKCLTPASCVGREEPPPPPQPTCLSMEDAYISSCCATKASGSCQDQATTYQACWDCNPQCFRPDACRHGAPTPAPPTRAPTPLPPPPPAAICTMQDCSWWNAVCHASNAACAAAQLLGGGGRRERSTGNLPCACLDGYGLGFGECTTLGQGKPWCYVSPSSSCEDTVNNGIFGTWSEAVCAASQAPMNNGCPFAHDGICDEPKFCRPGTDCTDCCVGSECLRCPAAGEGHAASSDKEGPRKASATEQGCTCLESWAPGDQTCSDGDKVYSGCNMAEPCDGDNGGGGRPRAPVLVLRRRGQLRARPRRGQVGLLQTARGVH